MTARKQTGKGLEHQIDASIRRVYQEALNEDVPDRFLELLEKLRQQDEGSASRPATARGDGK